MRVEKKEKTSTKTRYYTTSVENLIGMLPCEWVDEWGRGRCLAVTQGWRGGEQGRVCDI